MESIRCGQCAALLFRVSSEALRGPLETKCRRCGMINHLRAASFSPERRPTPENPEVPNGEDTHRPAVRHCPNLTATASKYGVIVICEDEAHQRQVFETLKQYGWKLRVRCRAPGGAIPDRFPPSPPTGGVTLDDHPDQPGAYTVVHPMYWILDLAGKHREHWPLRVQIGDGEAVESTLERRLTDYSAPRPGLDIAIPGDMLIDAFTEREIIDVEAVGERMRFRGRFEVTDNARRAAALMRSACARR